jgi:hypothetical protein
MWSFLNKFLFPSSILEFYYVYDGVVAFAFILVGGG